MAKRKIAENTTLQDVAKKAGVSLSTASRVLSGADYPVSKDVKERVMRTAKELKYTPNILARMLKSNSYPAIGVIVPTLQNPFFSQVILGIEAAARKKNYEIMIFSSNRSIEQERSNINSLLQNRVMALIIISIDNSSATLKNYIRCGGKVALLESNFRLDSTISTETDYVSAGKLAIEHLVEKGHRNIALLTAPLTKSYRRQILLGVRETMKEYQLPFEDENVFEATGEVETDTGLYEFDLGKHLVDEFIAYKDKFTAIIAVNDITAFGIIQALAQHNLSVPEDISVISFDNILYSGMISPPLTTIELPSSTMGSTVCNMLIDSINSGGEELTDVVFKFQGRLVERQSVQQIR